MGLFGQQHMIGVDIGHASVKVVGISLSKRPTFLGCKEITMDPKFLQKEGFNNPILIGQALQEALRTAAPKQISGHQAYSAISESLVFRKVIELPVLEDSEELREAIQLEAGQYLPEDIENVQIDYQRLGILPDGKTQQLMIVAAPKKVVEDHLAVFEAAHITLRGIGVKPGVLGQGLVRPDEKEAVVLVDIGSEVSSISVYFKHVVRVTGTVNLGGNNLKDPTTGRLDEEHWGQRVNQLASALADEVDHVIKFYANRLVGGGPVKELRLTGGGSMAVGLVEQMQQMIEMPISMAQPIIAVPPFCDRRFMGALGSALSPLYERMDL